MALRLRQETSLERRRSLLDLSRAVFGVMYAAIASLPGRRRGRVRGTTGQGWIWLSLGLLLAILVYMSLLGSPYYHRVRKAVGAALR